MRKLIFMLVAALLVVLAGAPSAAAEGMVHVRVAHFSADTPPVDIFVNGVPSAIKGLQYKSVTDWIELPPSQYTLSAVPKGGIRSGIFDLKADTWVTVAAIGSLKNKTLKLVAIDEDHSPIAKGYARLIVFHGIEDGPAVDVRSGDFVLIPKLAFHGTQGPAANKNDGAYSLNVKEGTYDFRVVPSGKITPVVLELSATELKENINYFVAAIGTRRILKLRWSLQTRCNSPLQLVRVTCLKVGFIADLFYFSLGILTGIRCGSVGALGRGALVTTDGLKRSPSTWVKSSSKRF